MTGRTNVNAIGDYAGLVRSLQRTGYLVDATGRVWLTEQEAAQIRALGFATACAGWWTVPPVPPELVRDNFRFEHLALHWPTYLRWEWDAGRTSGHVVDTRLQAPPDKVPPAQTLCPLNAWLDRHGKPEQIRILQSLWRRPVIGIRKRLLQQMMHRIPACRFNPAVTELLEAGFLRRTSTRLTLSPSAREAVGVHVKQLVAKRAQATAEKATRQSRARDARLARQIATGRPWGKRTAPPRHTSAWGRWMFAKRGGYAMQKKCRLLGINPTEKATRVRMMKQAAAQKARLMNAPPRAVPTVRPTGAPFELTDVEQRLQREADDAHVDDLLRWGSTRFRRR